MSLNQATLALQKPKSRAEVRLLVIIASAPSAYFDDPTKDWEIFHFGLHYKPIPNLVVKADYRHRKAKQGSLSDDFNLGFGFCE